MVGWRLMCSRYDPGARNAYLLSVKHTHLQSIGGRSQMGSDLPRRIHAGAQDWGQVLMFEGKNGPYFRAFTTLREANRAVAESVVAAQERNGKLAQSMLTNGIEALKIHVERTQALCVKSSSRRGSSKKPSRSSCRNWDRREPRNSSSKCKSNKKCFRSYCVD